MDPNSRLIVAIDVPDESSAKMLVSTLGDDVRFYKIGLEAFAAGWAHSVIEYAIRRNKQVMVDLKLYDIPETVARATKAVVGLGATFLTVHARPQTMTAACEAAVGSQLTILCVTVLTSLSVEDLEAEHSTTTDPGGLAIKRVMSCLPMGCFGYVASPLELAALRTVEAINNLPRFTLVVPGVRPGVATDDHKRCATPGEAIRAGADHIVVGRPIRDAASPRHAAVSIQTEIFGTLATMAPAGTVSL